MMNKAENIHMVRMQVYNSLICKLIRNHKDNAVLILTALQTGMNSLNIFTMPYKELACDVASNNAKGHVSTRTIARNIRYLAKIGVVSIHGVGRDKMIFINPDLIQNSVKNRGIKEHIRRMDKLPSLNMLKWYCSRDDRKLRSLKKSQRPANLKHFFNKNKLTGRKQSRTYAHESKLTKKRNARLKMLKNQNKNNKKHQKSKASGQRSTAKQSRTRRDIDENSRQRNKDINRRRSKQHVHTSLCG